jgi:hypothetical protein
MYASFLGMKTPCIWTFLISLSKKWSAFIRTGDKEKGEKIKNDSERHSKSIRYLRTDDAVMRYPDRPLLHYLCLPVFPYSIHPIFDHTCIPYAPHLIISINSLADYFQL